MNEKPNYSKAELRKIAKEIVRVNKIVAMAIMTIEDLNGIVRESPERSIDIALSEYAPGRSLVVNKQTYISGGLSCTAICAFFCIIFTLNKSIFKCNSSACRKCVIFARFHYLMY